MGKFTVYQSNNYIASLKLRSRRPASGCDTRYDREAGKQSRRVTACCTSENCTFGGSICTWA